VWKLCFDVVNVVFVPKHAKESAVRSPILSFLAALFILTFCKPKHGKTYQSVKTCIFLRQFGIRKSSCSFAAKAAWKNNNYQ
jgi:hypothetical protein